MSIWLNKSVFLDAMRVSRYANQTGFQIERSEHDVSTVEDLAHTYALGARMDSVSLQGFGASELDMDIMAKIEAKSTVVNLTATIGTGAVGTVALISSGLLMSYQIGGQYDTPSSFQTSFKPTGDVLTLGKVAYNATGTAGVTASGSGANFQYVALGAGQELILHVVNPTLPAVEGTSPTLDGTLQSSVDDTFASPQTVATFTQMTDTPSVQRVVVDGDTTPNTDTYYRVNWSAVGGTGSPKFFPVVAIGIRTKL